MSKFLIIILLFGVFGFASGQNNVSEIIDQRIINYLGDELVSKIQKERPQHFAYYKYILENSFELLDINTPKAKHLEIEPISNITCIDFSKNSKTYSSVEVESMLKKSSFNLLTSSLKRNKNNIKYYHLIGTNTIIALESESTITKNYKKR